MATCRTSHVLGGDRTDQNNSRFVTCWKAVLRFLLIKVKAKAFEKVDKLIG